MLQSQSAGAGGGRRVESTVRTQRAIRVGAPRDAVSFLFYAIWNQAMHKAIQSEYVLLLQCPSQL